MTSVSNSDKAAFEVAKGSRKVLSLTEEQVAQFRHRSRFHEPHVKVSAASPSRGAHP
jgi:hypothetical protein